MQRPSVIDHCYSINRIDGFGGDSGSRAERKSEVDEVQKLISRLTEAKLGKGHLKAEYVRIGNARGIRVLQKKCARTGKSLVTLPFFPLSRGLLGLIQVYERLAKYVVSPDEATRRSRQGGGVVATPLLQTAKGCLANSDSVRGLCNKLTQASAAKAGGSAELFKELRRGGRQSLLDPEGLKLVTSQRLMEEVAIGELAKGMDHHVETGGKDYSLTSGRTTALQEAVHTRLQAWFVAASRMGESFPSFLQYAVRAVNTLGDIAAEAQQKKWAAQGQYDADPWADLAPASGAHPLRRRSARRRIVIVNNEAADEQPGRSSDSDSTTTSEFELSPAGDEGDEDDVGSGPEHIACQECGKLLPSLDALRQHERASHLVRKPPSSPGVGQPALKRRKVMPPQADSDSAVADLMIDSLGMPPSPPSPTPSTPPPPPPPPMRLFSPRDTSCATLVNATNEPSCVALRPRSRGAAPQSAHVIGLVGLVKARKVGGGAHVFRLRVKWSDRATTSIIGLEDVVCTEDRPDQLPLVMVRWIDDAVAATGGLSTGWWLAQQQAVRGQGVPVAGGDRLVVEPPADPAAAAAAEVQQQVSSHTIFY